MSWNRPVVPNGLSNVGASNGPQRQGDHDHGAAQGLGQKMTEAVAARGANVALVDVDHLKMKDTLRLCSKVGSKVKDYAADVTDEQAVVALFDRLRKDFGSIDGVINNAGITSDGLLVKDQDGKVQKKMSLEDFHNVIAVDLRGVFLCGREAAAHVIEGRSGVSSSTFPASRAPAMSVRPTTPPQKPALPP
jgi:3-oxoacyl-[acyl-carrier protein] reductase